MAASRPLHRYHLTLPLALFPGRRLERRARTVRGARKVAAGMLGEYQPVRGWQRDKHVVTVRKGDVVVVKWTMDDEGRVVEK